MSSVAFQMMSVAIGWQIYSITHSAFALGLVGLSQFLPMFMLTLVVGHVADRYDRRTVILTCYTVQAIATFALLWLAHAAQPQSRQPGRLGAEPWAQ